MVGHFFGKKKKGKSSSSRAGRLKPKIRGIRISYGKKKTITSPGKKTDPS